MKAKREELGLKDYQNLELSELQDAFDEAMKDLRNNPGSDSYVMSAEDKEKEIDAENPRRVSFFH